MTAHYPSIPDGMTRPVSEHLSSCREVGHEDVAIVLGALRSARAEIAELADQVARRVLEAVEAQTAERIDRAVQAAKNDILQALQDMGLGVQSEVMAQAEAISAEVLVESASVRALIVSGDPGRLIRVRKLDDA